MPISRKRQRIWLIHLSNAQEGLCCHCKEPMNLLDPNREYAHDERNGWLDSSIEHVIPQSFFRDSNLPGANYFANMLAAHRGCNSERDHSDIGFELIEYHFEIHQKIFEAGCQHIPREQQALDNIEAYLPRGYSKEDFFELLETRKVAA